MIQAPDCPRGPESWRIAEGVQGVVVGSDPHRPAPLWVGATRTMSSEKSPAERPTLGKTGNALVAARWDVPARPAVGSGRRQSGRAASAAGVAARSCGGDLGLAAQPHP